jgi:vacuolar-type H+-ATPase subunit I/STV1
MSTTTIEQTVETTLRNAGYGSYVNQARPVVEKLRVREQEISDRLLEMATTAGLDSDEARRLLVEAGIEVRPEPEPEPETVEQTLASIKRSIEELTAFARSNGYRG